MLKTKITLGSFEIHNRLVMAPVAQEKSIDGQVTDELLNYYDLRTKGGYVGLVIIEHCYVRRDGKASSKQLSVAEDADMEGLKKLAKIIHNNGSKVIVQINHAGSSIREHVVSTEGVSASGIANPNTNFSRGALQKTHAMTTDEIDEMKEAFVNAALRVQAVGFDGVQVHSAHGYFLNQFYSPLTNHRNDSYTGKTIEGRIKLQCEIIKSIREKTGKDFLIGLRLGGCDYMENGSTIEDATRAAPKLVQAGLDFIDLTGGMCFYTRADHTEAGYFSDLSVAVKNVVDVPVVLAGGVKNRRDAEMLLKENKTDLVSVARFIYNDANWPKAVIGE